MAIINVKCPRCGSEQVIKHGISETGKQRYYCKNNTCNTKSFQLEHTYKACRIDTNEKIIKMTANASGIRDISRVLEISTYKVMSTLKKLKIQ